MARKFLRDFADGDVVDDIFLLADKQLRANRHASLYLLASLRDRTGVISGLMWNVSEESVAHVNQGDFVGVKGKMQVYQGGLQMIVTHIDHVDDAGLDPADFHPEMNFEVAPMLVRLREILSSISDVHVRALMRCFLDDESLLQALAQAPAGVKAHHAYHGGLLRHVLNMLEVAVRIDELYPEVDSSLLLAGIFLHDIGKVREMSWDPTLVYTDEGQLLGHMSIATEMLNEKLARLPQSGNGSIPEETVLRIKHMILSHHGTLEFGSARVPMTPEAIALHHLDNLDAKVHEFAAAIQEDPNGEARWTPFSPRLGRKLFKGDPQANGDAPPSVDP